MGKLSRAIPFYSFSYIQWFCTISAERLSGLWNGSPSSSTVVYNRTIIVGIMALHARIQRIHLKNHKNIGFLSNTGRDPLKITKLPSQHSMLGHHRHASETPFKWCFARRLMMACL